MNTLRIHSIAHWLWLCFIALATGAFGQKTHEITIQWEAVEALEGLEMPDGEYSIGSFGKLPVVHKRIALPHRAEVQIRWINQDWKAIEKVHAPEIFGGLRDTMMWKATVWRARDQWYAELELVPLKRVGDQLYRLERASFTTRIRPAPTRVEWRGDTVTRSVLADGEVYKIGVKQYGIHVIDAELLNALGLDVAKLDPQHVHLYGQRGGPLPETVGASEMYDLREIPLYFDGLDDGRWDAEDRIYFYAEGPHRWYYDTNARSWMVTTNIYDTAQYYFIKIDPSRETKRIRSTAMPPTVAYRSTSYDAYQRYEEDHINVLGAAPSYEGGGKIWVNDVYDNVRSRSYSQYFDSKHLVKDEPIRLQLHFVARSNSTNSLILRIGDNQMYKPCPTINPRIYEATYARSLFVDETLYADDFNIELEYPASGSVSIGWLDWIAISYRKEYDLEGEDQILVFDGRSLEHPSVGYSVKNVPQGSLVWDVTNPFDASVIEYERDGQTIEVRYEHQGKPWLHAIFNPSAELHRPFAVGKIDNQNLHGMADLDYLIICFEATEKAAQKLLQHRTKTQGLKGAVVRVEKIYNEFSSGRQDPTALRDFIKMLYDRSTDFRYVLLFGDGSYDYRGIEEDIPYESFIPVYETDESFDPILTYPSDDYFGLLDVGEGRHIRGLLDIAVGRLPARNAEEADLIVDRIIHYETSVNTHGEWKNRVLLIADDEDNNAHFNDIERLADSIQRWDTVYNIEKVYLDAYEQQVTPGGERYPQVTEDIYKKIYQGVFFMTYLGHGGPLGLAQERILQIPDILKWNNPDRLPLFITATCSFTPFDVAEFRSAGEVLIFHPQGGVSVLLSTVRLVYATQNYNLTNKIVKALTQDFSRKDPIIGDVFMTAKVQMGANDNNSKKFFLFGDPAMRLSVPKYRVHIDRISGVHSADFADTLGALDTVRFDGVIQDGWDKVLTDFNGKLYVTLFDKPVVLTTKGNDGGRPAKFTLQKNILHKSIVSVKEGRFSFTATLPLDIIYEVGKGKLSLYATDGYDDEARGSFMNIHIGKARGGKVQDDRPPTIALYLNDRSFVDGGICNPDPVLIVDLDDDTGINFSGTSIGHDIIAVLDGQSTYILNEFFIPAVDTPNKGSIYYPLANLPPGTHTILVRAWDIANNASEATLTFRVVDDGLLHVEDIQIRPNPVIGMPTLYFTHNQPPGNMQIQLELFTIRGELLHRDAVEWYTSGSSVQIPLAQFSTGHALLSLPQGMYLYRLRIEYPLPSGDRLLYISDMQKLLRL